MADLGVVVMAYGTPATPADVEAYYTHIRRGNAPTPEQLADLIARYDAIGGISPLAERTEAQRAALQAALDERAPGTTPRRARPEARGAVHRGRGRHPRRRRASSASSVSCSPRTTPGSRSGSTRSGCRPRPPSEASRTSRRRQLAPRADLPRVPRRRRARRARRASRAHQGALHGALAARAGARRRPVSRSAARVGGGGRRSVSASNRWAGWSVAGSPPVARPSRGGAPTSSR